jgi:signal transduction histidine kinase
MPNLARFTRLLPSAAAAWFAVAAVGLATAVQLALEGVYGDVFPWVTYCFAVFSAAWFGGLWSALVALALGYLVVTLLFASPGTLGISGKDTLTAFAVYMAYGLFAAFIAESLHRARRRAELAADQARGHSERLRQREESLREKRNELQALLETQVQTEAALRASEQRFRIALKSGAITVFEQDRDLRYLWIYPQDPAFPRENIGKTDAELLPDPDGRELMLLKSEVMRTGMGVRRTMRATLPEVVRYYDLVVEPHRDLDGRITGVCGAALDVTSQRLVEDALKLADRQKNEFLATLAHEFRSPLAAIGYANEAARLDAATDREGVEIIDHQVRHLTRLIDDLLDVARITEGKVQLKRTYVDAATIVERATSTVRPLLDPNGHELIVDTDRTEMPLFGDPMRLEQVLVNLLTNAVKYSPERGTIQLSAARQGHEIVLCVRDNGIGIPPQMLARVFDLFSQVHGSLDRSQGGLGIGLTLVRRLVEMHDGTIIVASDGVGRGSEFTVRLPVAESHASRGGSSVSEQTAHRGALLGPEPLVSP